MPRRVDGPIGGLPTPVWIIDQNQAVLVVQEGTVTVSGTITVADTVTLNDGLLAARAGHNI